MARGTRLFQAPRSPLIQGRSRRARPTWQPYLVALGIGLVWPVASSLPHEISAAGRDGLAQALSRSADAYLSGLPVLAPSVALGAALGVWVGGMWGARFRWFPGAVGAIGTWYAALVIIGLLG